MWFSFLHRNSLVLSRFYSSIKKKIDYSRVPQLVEKDLEESFMRGDGNGGQAVQKTSNCVQIRHLPTNIVVKYHGTRSLIRNREIARTLLINKLDNLYNKEMSVENQRKIIEKEKSLKRQYKNEKLRKLKMEYKKKNIEEKDDE